LRRAARPLFRAILLIMKMTAADVLKRYMEEDLPEFCELVLEHVNQPGNFGNLPIHVAAVRGLPEELDALIAGGADVNAAGELGNRPLHEAIGHATRMRSKSCWALERT
jgi:hypothetical protein